VPAPNPVSVEATRRATLPVSKWESILASNMESIVEPVQASKLASVLKPIAPSMAASELAAQCVRIGCGQVPFGSAVVELCPHALTQLNRRMRRFCLTCAAVASGSSSFVLDRYAGVTLSTFCVTLSIGFMVILL
jgi:hypothetical protein